MIKRYDMWTEPEYKGKGKVDVPIGEEYCKNGYYDADDVATLLEPPSKVPCPECGGSDDVCGCGRCDDTGQIYKYWTPAERDQWRAKNGLPPDPWVGAVWVLDPDGISGSRVYLWRNVVSACHAYPNLTVLCALGNTPPPKDDYRHGGENA